MQADLVLFGVDVSSLWLDINQYGSASNLHIDNSIEAISEWLEQIPKASIIGMEVTGRYHFLLAKLAFAAGMRVYVLNPKDIHYYAKGVGRRAKTDRGDALLIARYLAAELPLLREWLPMSQEQEQIQALFLRRSSLVKIRHALMMTTSTLTGVDTELAAALLSMQRLIDSIGKQILHLSKKQGDEYYNRMMAMRGIYGIGPLTAAYLAGLFSRVPFHSSDQAVCFLGMDLKFADSGKKQGKRRLSKRGPSEARRLLYNAAAAAGRGLFKPLLDKYRERLPYAGAVIALARKLIRIAFAIWQSGEEFKIDRFSSPFLTKTA